MTDDELLTLNAQGFIPGPDETEEEFRERVLKTKETHTEWLKEHLKELFDFEPGSLPVYYSNEKLTPWQGAACWVDEKGNVTLQLREQFRSGRYLGYSRDEILAHEAVHAARAAFQEPENEEFFSYATSEKKWRRVLGPILKRPWEAWAFLGTCMAGILWPEGILLSSGLLGWGFWRLIRGHRRIAKAALVLYGKVKDARAARAILFRMTDDEIRGLSRGQCPEGDASLRWRLIRLAYLGKIIG
jgi:hypothetical protein